MIRRYQQQSKKTSWNSVRLRSQMIHQPLSPGGLIIKKPSITEKGPVTHKDRKFEIKNDNVRLSVCMLDLWKCNFFVCTVSYFNHHI